MRIKLQPQHGPLNPDEQRKLGFILSWLQNEGWSICPMHFTDGSTMLDDSKPSGCTTQSKLTGLRPGNHSPPPSSTAYIDAIGTCGCKATSTTLKP